MCIPHGATVTKSNGFVQEEKPRKHIQKVSQEMFEKGDPNFVDERTSNYQTKKKVSFFAILFE